MVTTLRETHAKEMRMGSRTSIQSTTVRDGQNFSESTVVANGVGKWVRVNVFYRVERRGGGATSHFRFRKF
jgi:hypothetical protein